MKIDSAKLFPFETDNRVMDRSGQAELRIYYIGCLNKHGNNRVFVYPCSDGRAWKVAWKATTLAIPPEKQSAYIAAVEPYRNATWAEKHRTYIDVPCATDGCPSFASVSVHDLELDEEQEFSHPEVEHYFCRHCKGFTDKFLDRWKLACPKVFREGKDASDPRFFPPTAWNAMQLWAKNYMLSDRSLYVYGQSGVCKSRMMFELLRQFIVPLKLNFKIFAGGEFRREQELIMQTRFDRKWERITTDADDVDLLVFDDFGQDDLMPSMKSNLRLLIDRRLGNGLKTIFLANVSPQDLHQVYGVGFDTNSLKRRILDFCDCVPVSVSKQSLDDAIYRRRQADKFGGF